MKLKWEHFELVDTTPTFYVAISSEGDRFDERSLLMRIKNLHINEDKIILGQLSLLNGDLRVGLREGPPPSIVRLSYND